LITRVFLRTARASAMHFTGQLSAMLENVRLYRAMDVELNE